MLSLHFILAKKDHTKITKRTNVWLDMINVSNPYLLLSLLWDRTWYFCRVAVAYVATSVDVYPEVASGFSKVYLLLFLGFPARSLKPSKTDRHGCSFRHHHHPNRSLAGSTSTPAPTQLCI
jgi:hypothetical protein